MPNFLQLKSLQTFIYLEQNNSIVSPFTNYVLLTQLIMEIKLLWSFNDKKKIIIRENS